MSVISLIWSTGLWLERCRFWSVHIQCLCWSVLKVLVKRHSLRSLQRTCPTTLDMRKYFTWLLVQFVHYSELLLCHSMLQILYFIVKFILSMYQCCDTVGWRLSCKPRLYNPSKNPRQLCMQTSAMLWHKTPKRLLLKYSCLRWFPKRHFWVST